MDKDFLLPDVGEGLEQATIVDWLVDIGDSVSVNQPVCVIETAKAEVELPSPYEGRVAARNGELGEELRVGDLLVRIDTAEPAVEQVNGVARAGEPTPNPVLVGYGASDAPVASRRARRWTAPGGGGPPSPPDPTRSPPSGPAGRRLAKPPVRKLARDLGVDLAAVTPTGSRGEVTRDDVRNAAAATTGADGRAVSAAGPGDEVIPVRGVRARIAQRMALSRSTIPEATCGVEVDCTELLRVRKALRETPGTDGGETITPFSLIAWMVPRALRAAPVLNASFDAEQQVIRVSRAVHLGLATATDQGLLVPVLRDAHTATVAGLAAGVSRLAEGARLGALGPTELSGSTFTITNYGALGLDEGNPVINYPEAAILGVGAIREQAVAFGGRIVARPRTKLICAFDHRACDGAEAARFLTTLKRLVEEPMTSLLYA